MNNAVENEKKPASSKLIQRIIVVGVVIAIIVVFYVFDLGKYFSLEYIKESQARFDALYQEHRVLVVASYMAIYIVMAALSLPGAAVMTLLGGALFGRLVGTIAFPLRVLSEQPWLVL